MKISAAQQRHQDHWGTDHLHRVERLHGRRRTRERGRSNSGTRPRMKPQLRWGNRQSRGGGGGVCRRDRSMSLPTQHSSRRWLPCEKAARFQTLASTLTTMRVIFDCE
jgi:hypothetical protein